MKRLFSTIMCILTIVFAYSQSPNYYGTLSSKMSLGSDSFHIIITEIQGGNKPYPNASYDETEIVAGQVMWAGGLRFTIRNKISSYPLVIAVKDTTGTGILASKDLINTRVAIGQEEYSNGYALGFVGNVADGNSGNLVGLAPSDWALIQNYYRKNTALAIAVATNPTVASDAVIAKETPPTFDPSPIKLARIWHDTMTNNIYKFLNGKWYSVGILSQSNAPQITYTNSATTISNEQAEWFDTDTDQYYKVINGSWSSLSFIDITNVVYITGEQLITGKKTFQDTIVAQNGIRSEGIIDTKGVKTSGTTTQAASQINGVQSNSTIEVTTNTTLNGTYNNVVANTTSGDITLTLPTPTYMNKGWYFLITKKGNNLVKIVRPSQVTITMYSNYTITVKNDDSSWELKE